MSRTRKKVDSLRRPGQYKRLRRNGVSEKTARQRADKKR